MVRPVHQPLTLRLVSTPAASSESRTADGRGVSDDRGSGAPATIAMPLRHDDPRWVLAAHAQLSLEGGRAAILSPDRRRRLMSLARRTGLRPFDAALVIAIVQDAARSGQDLVRSAGGAPDVASRLALIRAPESSSTAGAFALAILLASGIFVAAMSWLGV
jgi:hypothetical protein